jgi:histidyl-tRNA synthetase
VFECAVESGKWSIAGGGRYDRLVESYGGQATPAVGWSIGIERVIELMRERKMLPKLDRKLVYVAPATDEARKKAVELTQELRASGIAAETDLMKRKLAKQFAYADSIKASKVVVVGPKDLENGQVTVRDMATGSESLVDIKKLAGMLG